MQVGAFIQWVAPLFVVAVAHADDNEAKVRWAWTCGGKVFYGMNVTPDGKAKPFAEQNGETLKVELKREPEKWAFSDICPDKHDFLEIHDSADLFSTSESSPCYQIVDFRYKLSGSMTVPSELEEVHAAISLGYRKHLDLQIARDDAEWRFIVSKADLTTEKYARELRVGIPNTQYTPKAQAGAHFITGECVLDRRPAP